jgi:hypothetical protein
LLNIHHLHYATLYHESLILDGWHYLVVLCETHHTGARGIHAWAEARRRKPNAVALQEYWVYTRLHHRP